MYSFLRTGSLSRSTGSTNMNQLSSRSHAIFTLILDQRIFCEGISLYIYYIGLKI
jgi:hypothetical protein